MHSTNANSSLERIRIEVAQMDLAVQHLQDWLAEAIQLQARGHALLSTRPDQTAHTAERAETFLADVDQYRIGEEDDDECDLEQKLNGGTFDVERERFDGGTCGHGVQR